MTKLEIRTRYSETDESDKNGRWARLVYCNGRLIAWISLDKNVPNYYLTRTFFPVHDNDMPLAHDHFETYQQAFEWVEYHWDQFLKVLFKDFEEINIEIMKQMGGLGIAAANAGDTMRHATEAMLELGQGRVIIIGSNPLILKNQKAIEIVNKTILTAESIIESVKVNDLKIPDTRPFYHNLGKNKKKRRY